MTSADTEYSRTQRLEVDTGFCMDVGQVKTGIDNEDTYIKMLQEIVRVTAPVAYGIVAEYRNLEELMKGLRDKGPLALQDLKV
jgi:crossover junction endonuclease EME1